MSLKQSSIVPGMYPEPRLDRVAPSRDHLLRAAGDRACAAVGRGRDRLDDDAAVRVDLLRALRRRELPSLHSPERHCHSKFSST
jgi:hypothetical protein